MAGRILTFYSYKGGTGRSMAVANTAWILASTGLRVLAVDWDLEAPGLHRYFHPFLPDPNLAVSPGVIDLVWKFAEATMDTEAPDDPNWHEELAQISPYAMSIEYGFPEPGTIDFVPAGRQDPTYSALVSQFDWNNFYDRLGGGGFLEALKRNMRDRYDYVLIDSRTGLSDTAGICTVQLPDILVNCFSLSNQAINGAQAVAGSVYRQRTNSDLRIFPVPMRVEDGEQDKLDASRDYARALFGRYLSHLADPERYWGDVEVPYKSFYAYEEILATIGDRPRQENTVLAATERVVGYLTDGRVTQLAATPTEPERKALLARFQRVGPKAEVSGSRPAAGGPRVFISYAHESAEHFDSVRDLWYLLRAGGIDARLDRPPGQRREDFPAWLRDELSAADLILVVASAGYRAADTEPGETANGLGPEVRLVRQRALRTLGVVLPGGSADDLPGFLDGSEHAVIQELTAAGIEPLRRQLILLAAPQLTAAGSASPSQYSTPHRPIAPDLERALLDLATAVHRQWREEAALRRLFDPFPMPVRWSATDRPVAARTSLPADHVVGDGPLLPRFGSPSGLGEAFLQLPQKRLVVLGRPGAGKTTAMIRLTLDLLAGRSEQGPVPVLLSAASWQPDLEPLVEWIIRRLTEDYPQLTLANTYGPDAARRLVDASLVLPVLDGLDELPSELRTMALQELARAASHLPMVVTSRTAEYQETVTKTGRVLPRAAVIELQPMAMDDVASYLAATQPGGDHRWDPVLNELRGHPNQPLAWLLSVPLMLDLARTTYSTPDTDPAELLDGLRFSSVVSLEAHLLDSYLQASYEWPGPTALARSSHIVDSTSASRWLTYLARFLETQQTRDLAWWQLHRAVPAGTIRALLGIASFLFTTLAFAIQMVLLWPVGDRFTGSISALATGLFLGSMIAVLSQPLPPRHPTRRLRLSRSGLLDVIRFREPLDLTRAHSPQRTLRDDRTATALPVLVIAVALAMVGVIAIMFGVLSLSRGTELIVVLIAATVMSLPSRSAWGWFITARFWLALRGRLPWRLMRFLADARRRGILRQAGPVYQFRHAMLQQHLVSRITDR